MEKLNIYTNFNTFLGSKASDIKPLQEFSRHNGAKIGCLLYIELL